MGIFKLRASFVSNVRDIRLCSKLRACVRCRESRALQVVGVFSSALLLVSIAYAQNATTVSTATAGAGLYHTPAQIPPVLLQQFLALGSRLQTPGSERITLLGVLTNAAGSSNVQIVIQLGGKMNITWTSQPSQNIVFNGAAAAVSGSVQSKNDLLEAFVDDLPETLMLAAGAGAVPRLLGQKFTNPAGGFCGYYDVATFGVAVKQTTPLVKRYCFDSGTSLLRTVRYMSSSSQTAVTQFGGWGTVNGQAVPGTVIRTLGGVQVFQFQAQSAAVSASIADNTFTLP